MAKSLQELWPEKGRDKSKYSDDDWVYLHIANEAKGIKRCVRSTQVKAYFGYREITKNDDVDDITYLSQGRDISKFEKFFGGRGCKFYLAKQDETNFNFFDKSKK